ncbi:HNH endonuclease [Paenibacillus sp. FJAT-26967]|uniref:HNH endonuclease n=1 Tax=Paenibacillus sp. FJAT-26967 TaxID=1729690 RepID=UPI0008398A0C|nr:HNH endonuclease signature motif containing protein [Paenibacillus sp. FJAT-26967]
MKKMLSFVLTLSLFLSLSITTALASSISQERTVPNTKVGFDKVKDQLKSLHKLGYLDKDYSYDTFSDYKPKYFEKYNGNLDIYNESTQIIALDTTTKKQINDIQKIIDAADTNSLVTPQKSSLAFFEVKFFFGVGNADTTDAEIINTGTVLRCWGIGCPKEYEIKLRTLVSTNQYGSYGIYASISEDARVLEDVIDTEKIYNTHFWKYDNIIYAEKDPSWPAGAQNGTIPLLLNKKGLAYPLNYSDPQSGIPLYVPPTNLPVNQVTRSNDYRSKFISYYEGNWGTPTKFTWGQVEVHHMKPLKYGGSNDFYNLIPLMNYFSSSNTILKHSQLTRWWDSY